MNSVACNTCSSFTIHFLSRMSKNQTELRTIGWYVRRFFFDSSRFSPSNLLVVTWDQVGYYHNGTKQVRMCVSSVVLEC